MKTRSVLLAACVALTLSACGTSGDAGSDTEASGAAEAGAFPVTVDHAYGSTTIDAEPMRIVTIGWSGQDSVIALNKVPVAMESFSGDGIENNILPWDASRLNGAKPVLMTTNPDIPFEQILGLDPDVILAVYSGIDEGEYKRLSDIAPTVAFPDQPWDTAWDKQMSMIGAALGQPAQAQTLIDETGAYFEKQAADHPQFQGKTSTYAMRTDEGLIVFCGTELFISTGSGLPGPHDTLNNEAINGQVGTLANQVIVGGVIEAAVNYCTHNLAYRLNDLKIPATFDFKPTGTHSWGYWQDDLHNSWPMLAHSLGV